MKTQTQKESIEFAVQGCIALFYEVYGTHLTTEEAQKKVLGARRTHFRYLEDRGREAAKEEQS